MTAPKSGSYFRKQERHPELKWHIKSREIVMRRITMSPRQVMD